MDRSAIERNKFGEEEPHTDDPELWNIDGTEMDFLAGYKVGGQMWYIQSRLARRTCGRGEGWWSKRRSLQPASSVAPLTMLISHRVRVRTK